MLIGQSQGVSNVHPKGPVDELAKVRATANKLNTHIFVPDNTALGYKIRHIEYTKVLASSDLKGLPDRYAVRMTLENPYTVMTFDFYQVPGHPEVPVERQLKWLLKKNYFEAVLSPQDTFAATRRGDRDIAFVGGLVSEPSAKEILNRLVKVYPKY